MLSQVPTSTASVTVGSEFSIPSIWRKSREYLVPKEISTWKSGWYESASWKRGREDANFNMPFASTPYIAMHIYFQGLFRDGEFVSIESGKFHNCALSPDHSVTCWGDNEFGQAAAPDGVKFKEIFSERATNCGITLNNRVRCWGRRDGLRQKLEQSFAD